MKPIIVIRGVGEIGSAVAHTLFAFGQAVVIHQPSPPLTTRRRMSFADAVFDGTARLEGIIARWVASLAAVPAALDARREIPVVAGELEALLEFLHPAVLVDARMRKRVVPENQRALAPFTIGLGPNFVAGEAVDVVVETSWDSLGTIIRRGTALPLMGEPRMLAGYGRERFVYAPLGGRFRTDHDIGTAVTRGKAVATIDSVVLYAPLDGILRGITRDNLPVPEGMKVIEVDPRGDPASARGIGERPLKIAEAVLRILNEQTTLTTDRAAAPLPLRL